MLSNLCSTISSFTRARCSTPGVVILKSFCARHILWSSEVKIHNRESIMCTCLIKGDVWPSSNIFSRHGPEISLSLHLTGKENRKILICKSWSRSYIRPPHAHNFWPWMAETSRPSRILVSARARGKDKSARRVKCDSLFSKQFLRELRLQDKYYQTDQAITNEKGPDFGGTCEYSNHPVEEPWLLQPSSSFDRIEDKVVSCELSDELEILEFIKNDLMQSKPTNEPTFDPVSYSKGENILGPLDNNKDLELQRSKSESETFYPIEEPWLLQPYVLANGSDNEEPAKNEALALQSQEKHLQILEKVYPEEEERGSVRSDLSNLEDLHLLQDVPKKLALGEESGVALKNSVSTVILINSSRCTMQRIAVLEDEKLVELLLEPVKDNVQCDSVYLGVVKKLVPGMTSALVNIGCSRDSLICVKPDSEPFLFPPFLSPKKPKGSNGSLLKDPVITDIDHGSLDVEAVDEVIDDSVDYIQDDIGEHESEDEFDVSEVNKENMNGSVIGSELKVDSLHEGKRHGKETHTGRSTWAQIQEGTKIIAQVNKEVIGSKGPRLTANPTLKSRFWILCTRGNVVRISKKITGAERKRLNAIAKLLKPDGFSLTVRTVAAGHSIEEMRKDLEGLLSTWKNILENAKSAALAADEGVKGAVPVLLHKAMGQTLSVVQDYFNSKVERMVVDSPRTYHEITNYLQEMDPDFCDRLELYSKKTPLFDEYNIEEEVNNMLDKRVALSNGGYLIIEQTEALVSIDVNGGHGMFGQGTTQEKAVFEVNLAAAKQIAREIRLRDIGGIIVVDFIDMLDKTSKRLVYEEMKEAVERDRSFINISELSENGLMEITRMRVRPSVTFMISEPCSSCHAIGRVEALETTLSKIEREICRFLATTDLIANPDNPKSWPTFNLWVDQNMSNYLTSGKRAKLGLLSSSLKVLILLKVARGYPRGKFELKLFGESEDNKNKNKNKNQNKNKNPNKVSFEQPKEVEKVSHRLRKPQLPNEKLNISPTKKWNGWRSSKARI